MIDLVPGEPVAGVILAGGRARRMGGGDKMLLAAGGRSLLAHVVARARPHTAALVLSANGDPARFAAFGLPVAADGVTGQPGPLAGILAGMDWVRDTRPQIRWLAGFAADTPLLPVDLVPRLASAVAASAADLGCAASGGRRHHVFGLWPVGLADALRRALVEEDLRQVGAWMARYRVAEVEWSGGAADPFLNVNTPADLESVGRRLAGGG